MLRKTITVQTNDKENEAAKLGISGKIEKFAKALPLQVKLLGSLGKPIVAEVKIIPQEKYPFSITEAKALDGENILCSFDEIADPLEKGYVLRIENTKKEKGRYRDTIVLKTTSKIKPELKIRVYGRIVDLGSDRPVQENQNLQKFLDAIQKQQLKNADGGKIKAERKSSSQDAKKFFEQLIKQNQEKQEMIKQKQEKKKAE